MFTTRTVTFVALAASAAAQLSSLSTNCTSALTGVATNADAAACLSPGSLLSLVAGGNTTSVISPIDTWLTTLCAAPACSNATLAAVITNVTSGCSTELSELGLSSDMASSITTLVEQYYPTVRQVVCLKDGSTNCVTQTLTNIQNVEGTLSLTNLITIVEGSTAVDLPSNISCTDCIKEAYNVINTSFPSLVSDAAPSLQSTCGTNFTDGSDPTDITESASTSGASSASASSGALGAVPMMSQGIISALGVSGLLIISTVFTVLA